MADQENTLPEPSVIRDRAVAVFNRYPCLWQVKVTHAILRRDKDIVSIAGTGMGKTLTFWLPLLFRPTGMQIVVTPLNILGKQNIEVLEKAGFKGVFIGADSATAENFRAIEDLQYQAIVVSPEQLMKPGGRFEKLLLNPAFTSHIISLVFDEAHCISTWGSFRPEYSEVGRLRYFLPSDVPIMVTSATLPKHVLDDVKKTLQFRADKTFTSRRNCDRANISIVVRPIRNPFSSFLDLQFLVRNWGLNTGSPKKFIVFFDDVNEAVNACLYVRSLIPRQYREQLKWFCADMTATFKAEEIKAFESGERLGFFSTESFGMGMDIKDVKHVVQWRARCSSMTCWQRAGRGARDICLDAVFIFLVDKDYFDVDEGSTSKKRDGRDLPPRESPTKHSRTTDKPRIEVNADLNMDPSQGGREIDSILPPMQTVIHDLQDKYLVELGQQDKPVRRKKKELDPVLDDMVNADRRGIGCRRIPILASLENNKADVDVCDSSHQCTRCSPALPSLCCDLHNPAILAEFDVQEEKRHRTSNRSRIAPKEKMDPSDLRLQKALEEWRQAKTAAQFSAAHLRDFGPALIMPNKVLDRIVACASAEKLSTPADLERETRWSKATTYGNEILEVIREHAPKPPPPLFANTPLQRSLSTATGPPLGQDTHSKAPRKQRHCGACGQVGHIASNSMCPSRQKSEKENQSPDVLPK
ncbi:hypothetical protein AB1N83_009629 [Pleurotus pulmonarius]